jgi:hypothetical protein
MSAAVDKKRAVTIKVLFWIIFTCFILVVTTIFTPDFMEEFIGFEIGFFVFGGIAVALSIVLIILASRPGYDKLPKSFLILSGSSIVGILAGSVLHNLIYGLVVEFGDGSKIIAGVGGFFEVLFFLIGNIVCPVAFIAGAIGTIVMIAKKII